MTKQSVAADETTRLRAENERLRQKIKDLTSDLLFVTGWNAGFEHAIQEALNLKFPAHIRKMWSGDEVQKWIDHQTSEARAALKGGQDAHDDLVETFDAVMLEILYEEGK